jgi:hypothetical protein
MYCQDYWVIEYKDQEGGDNHLKYIIANYRQYDKNRIESVYSELRPEWKIIKIHPIKNLEFKTPDGG